MKNPTHAEDLNLQSTLPDVTVYGWPRLALCGRACGTLRRIVQIYREESRTVIGLPRRNQWFTCELPNSVVWVEASRIEAA